MTSMNAERSCTAHGQALPSSSAGAVSNSSNFNPFAARGQALPSIILCLLDAVEAHQLSIFLFNCDCLLMKRYLLLVFIDLSYIELRILILSYLKTAHSLRLELMHKKNYNFFMQVENEYGFYEGADGDAGKSYASWAANMAVSQNTGVPWIMCQEWDTPETVALAAVPCKHMILLSGTPMQNDLEEFFAMVNFTNPGILGDALNFRRYYQLYWEFGPKVKRQEFDIW